MDHLSYMYERFSSSPYRRNHSHRHIRNVSTKVLSPQGFCPRVFLLHAPTISESISMRIPPSQRNNSHHNLKDCGLLSIWYYPIISPDMVVGGTDATSNTVEFAVAEMMNKPEAMRKSQQELETVVGKDETCIIGGYTIPKGARVFVSAWAIHRDPSIWENLSEFDPESFLNSYEWDYSGNDFNYFLFGSGRRICAGTAMTERTFMYSLASVLHSFDWKLPEGEKLDVSYKFGIVLKKKIPIVVIPTPRLSDLGLYE
ncbi:cytochrome P450, family 706, subfamily A, polypeptide 7 [Actinidia rufa]|uniref:Cytochrome P450, family 706, subfamily A, polypeptide 7 n=1 Tax=Actinidia rufa TaxID=165716 RepID=A0A7J0FR67_9ERIC|nr:cytochrome P450, family 706, subfamily A, polypeptide 7 [Actinidia rufa]